MNSYELLLSQEHNGRLLCQHSRYFDADIANARLWSLMDKHQMTETLLVNMKKELTRKLLSNQWPGNAETLHKRLQVVNITLMRLLQERGLYEWAEKLLFDISDKQANDSEDFLCKASGNDEIDIALTRLWQLMGKSEQAEKLLLSMSNKHQTDSIERLCRITGKRGVDLNLALLWQVMEKLELCGKLLLNMSHKHPR